MAEGTGKAIKFARVETASSGSVDIVIADMVVRVGGNFDPDHLVKVLQAVRKA
ncbi:IS66 family insertion sequence element accessory protein TnpB [Agrobacterium radiobacter]|uniref:IS66 family insertion sequence element accessory protein TnpB n=1 Tax=Agrobacterium radiobacter TaxID=362 RepID=UPI003466E668